MRGKIGVMNTLQLKEIQFSFSEKREYNGRIASILILETAFCGPRTCPGDVHFHHFYFICCTDLETLVELTTANTNDGTPSAPITILQTE